MVVTTDGVSLSKLDISEQLDLLKSVLESSTEYSIAAVDLQGTIVAWNAGAKRIYGWDASEVLGKNATIIFTPEDIAAKKLPFILSEVRLRSVWTGEMIRIRKDGSRFTALVTVTLRKNQQGEAVGYTAIARDLTGIQNALRLLNKLEASKRLLQLKNQELEKSTRLAQEASNLKSEFLANVSHELRTPLNGIIGFAKLLYDGLVDPRSPKSKEFLGDIIYSANQLLSLINDVLDLSKIEAGKMEFHAQKVDLSKMLYEILDNFRLLILEKNIKIRTEVDPALRFVQVDPDKLKQVIFNYVSNALKFTPPGGRVNVSICNTKPDFFQLQVEDTGIGIHAEDQKKLFIKFQQLDASTKKMYAGTGLGLALTKRIVEAQGGEVGVKSTFGKGSTFYAILPCFYEGLEPDTL
ncbi:MAG: PAS domain-containing sensor histidine kinase [Gammaproteobacteria bacterium]|nr:PAS domain-containing sensor histidine kinase [Gammaproteobacteria bacterium]